MTAIAKKIEQEIQQLPLEDMLTLHEHLLASIREKEECESLDPKFREEIRRRIEEIDSGNTKEIGPFKNLEKM